VLLAFIAVIGRSLARGRAPDCNCFGRLSAGPVGRKTLVRNGFFAALAGAVIIAGPGRAMASAFGWLGLLTPIQRASFVAAVALVALLAFEGWLLVNLVRQNGRILNRVTALETAVASGGGHRTDLPLLPSRDASNDHRHSHQHGAQRGLPVGDMAPPVRLPDLDGDEVDLADLRGTPTVLLFWSPTCGFCQQMLPDLLAWDAKTPTDVPKLVIVSTGSAEDNRALGLTAPVLLDPGFATAGAFGATGTPQAVLVDPNGAIGSPLAAGAHAVLRLVNTRLSPI
jgi:peroxiredoxin